MKIGSPKEIKVQEYRVGLTPAGVKELCLAGHEVFIETQAGSAIGYSDELYQKAGAVILSTAEELFAKANLIIKVKEPQAKEIARLKPGHTLFTYLHLAADREQTLRLMTSGGEAIAYETVTGPNGSLPLLAPMSEVAGRLSIQAGMRAMEKHSGGNGILLSGVPGVAPAKVLVIGGGVVGYNAARIASGVGAEVTIMDKSLPRLNSLDTMFAGRVKTFFASQENLENELKEADLVIGAVLVPGALAPKLVSREMLKLMKKGTVIVDVAIDQGGCFETSKATTHENPTYEVEGIIHYCVANMPGAVARTSTLALTNATLPLVLELANKGSKRAMAENPHLAAGLSIQAGRLTNEQVRRSLKL